MDERASKGARSANKALGKASKIQTEVNNISIRSAVDRDIADLKAGRSLRGGRNVK